MIDWLQIGVLSAVATACALLGPFLVLRQLSMFANSLSHTILLGIALAFLITGSLYSVPTLLCGAAIAALLTALLTSGLKYLFRLQEDASIGLVFTTLFALGIALVSLWTRNVHIGIEAVMGNADILQYSDLWFALALLGTNVSFILLFYKPLQLTSFDPLFGKTVRVHSFQLPLMILTAMTCIGAFRAVGTLLVLAFLVGPFLTARLFSDRLHTILILSPLIGIGASIAGAILSWKIYDWCSISLSTGGLIAVLIGMIYLGGQLISSHKRRKFDKLAGKGESS